MSDFVIENGELKRYVGAGGKVVIPDEVTGIGAYAFSSCYALTKITFPKGLKSIGKFAFQYCIRLKEVTIPHSVVTIGPSAFYKCDGLKKVILEHRRVASVKTFLKETFGDGANTILFDLRNNSVVEILGTRLQKARSLLCFVENLKKGINYDSQVIQENNEYIHKNIKWLGEYALKNIVFMQYMIEKRLLTCAGAMAYVDELDESVEFSLKAMLVAYIDSFGVQARQSIVQQQMLKQEKELSKDPDSEEELNKIWDSIVLQDGSLALTRFKGGAEAVVIPEKIGERPVTRIEDKCFSGKKKLKEVFIGQHISSVGSSVFSDCGRLKRLTVHCIGALFRINQWSVEELVLGGDSKRVKLSLYWGFKNLKRVVIEEGVDTQGIDYSRWTNGPALESIIVKADHPKYTTKDGVLYSKDGKSLLAYPARKMCENFVVPNGVKKIETEAFYGSVLKNIELPDGLIVIDDKAFICCRDLESIIIPGSVTTIGEKVFDIGIFANGHFVKSSVTIIAPKGSYAEKYAKQEGLKFKRLN